MSYKSKKKVSQKNKKNLVKDLDNFLLGFNKIYCKALKRTVSLSKLPNCLLQRKTSATDRLQKFWVAIDILKHEKKFRVRENKGCLEYEISGMDILGQKIYIHLREELSLKKDRILFFISCY